MVALFKISRAIFLSLHVVLKDYTTQESVESPMKPHELLKSNMYCVYD